MSGMSTLLKAFGVDLSPEGVKKMLAEYGIDYNEVVTLMPKMAATLDEFNARLSRVETMQGQILDLLMTEGKYGVTNNTGSLGAIGSNTNALVNGSGNSTA